MYQEDRLLSILEYLNSNQSMSVNEICDHFQVSRDIARRDILKLVEQVAAIRTWRNIASCSKGYDLSLSRTCSIIFRRKNENCKKALSLLQENKQYKYI